LVEFGGDIWCTYHSQRLEISFTPFGPDFRDALHAFGRLHSGCFDSSIFPVEYVGTLTPDTTPETSRQSPLATTEMNQQAGIA
jgi:hypothetical protein